MWLYLILGAIGLILFKDNNYKWIYIIVKSFRRDMVLLAAFLKVKLTIFMCEWKHLTVTEVFSSIARKNPHQVAIYFENENWTYNRMERYSNKIARYYQSQGFKKGDCIALLLENSGEYPCFWLGLSKIGVITSLINTNLVSSPLLHSLTIAQCKAIIFGSNLTESVKTISKDLQSYKLYQFNEKEDNGKEILEGATDVRTVLKEVSDDKIVLPKLSTEKDSLFYIYTSGTTGMPKAALISHVKFMIIARMMHFSMRLTKADNLYIPLPLYHTAGCVLGLGQSLVCGTTVTIRKKFSASNYWKDCEKYNCTIAQYIGEMCRYVLAASSKDQTNHCVRAVIGNGLRPQIWKQFVDAFNIQTVYEFYGSTEGNSNFINVGNVVGCVGAIPWYADFLYPITLIRCHEATGEPIRNSDGLCTKCKPNEVGLLVGLINPKKALLNFKGYTNQEATDKKILQNVFQRGDKYFNSGDILVRDEYGNIFFKDRTGDTFRWKGENVSTAEVEAVISNVVQLNDAAVYGVEIPGSEGKAGMAAIVDTNKSVDIEKLGAGLIANLPSYSIPLFIRIMETIELTGTYKMKKVDLQAEGFDITKLKDKIYFFNSKLKKYVELSNELYDQILSGKLSL